MARKRTSQRKPGTAAAASAPVRAEALSKGIGLGKADWAAVGFLIAAIFAVFGRSLTFGFVNWDDPTNITSNGLLLSERPWAWLEFWTRPYAELYIPVFYTWLKLDVTLSGGAMRLLSDPFSSMPVFHASNLLIHCAAAVGLYGLTRLLLQEPGWLVLPGVLLFALHPLQCESVCWITGRKDLLAGCFSIWSILAFAMWMLRPGRLPWVWLIVSLGLFVLGLLSKPSAVSVPFLVLSVAWALWRMNRTVVAFLIIECVLAAAVVLVTTRSQESSGPSPFTVAIWKRPFVASDTLLFYLWKLSSPMNLIPIHGRVNSELFASSAIWITLPIVAALALASLRLPRLVRFGFLWWCFALLPVLGLTPFYYQYLSNVADRYAYLAIAGLGIAISAVLPIAIARFPQSPWAPVFAQCAAIAAFSVISFQQCGFWRNSETLWQRQIAVNPKVGLARYSLGLHYQETGQLQKATDEFLETLKVDPSTPEAYSSLMDISTDLGKPEAIRIFAEAALKNLEPTSLDKIQVRGHALLKLGRYDEAAVAFRNVTNGMPDDSEAHRMLGQCFFRAGRFAEAEAPLRQSIRLNDRVWQSHETLALSLQKLGRIDEAIRELEVAVSLEPEHPRLKETLMQVRSQSVRK